MTLTSSSRSCTSDQETVEVEPLTVLLVRVPDAILRADFGTGTWTHTQRDYAHESGTKQAGGAGLDPASCQGVLQEADKYRAHTRGELADISE